MRLLWLALVLAGCSQFEPSGRVGGTQAPVPMGTTSPPTPGGPPRPIDAGGVVPPGYCVPRSALPAGCALEGQWRLTHSQPDMPCPFGASRHDIRFYEMGELLCLDPGADFQGMGAGNPGTCALMLAGFHVVPAAAPPYTETWAARLTFVEDGGSGETQVVVQVIGQNDPRCTRKFQTAIERK